MQDVVEGGCKCGLVRFRGTRADAPVFRCHCRDCQQLTGTGHANMVPLVVGTFTISDPCRTFEMTGGSGRPTWSGFCPNCGSPILRRADILRDRVFVHAAALDDPSHFAPENSIFSDAAQPWDHAIVGEGR